MIPGQEAKILYASQPKKKNHRNNIVTNSRKTLKALSALQKIFLKIYLLMEMVVMAGKQRRWCGEN